MLGKRKQIVRHEAKIIDLIDLARNFDFKGTQQRANEAAITGLADRLQEHLDSATEPRGIIFKRKPAEPMVDVGSIAQTLFKTPYAKKIVALSKLIKDIRGSAEELGGKSQFKTTGFAAKMHTAGERLDKLQQLENVLKCGEFPSSAVHGSPTQIKNASGSWLLAYKLPEMHEILKNARSLTEANVHPIAQTLGLRAEGLSTNAIVELSKRGALTPKVEVSRLEKIKGELKQLATDSVEKAKKEATAKAAENANSLANKIKTSNSDRDIDVALSDLMGTSQKLRFQKHEIDLSRLEELTGKGTEDVPEARTIETLGILNAASIAIKRFSGERNRLDHAVNAINELDIGKELYTAAEQHAKEYVEGHAVDENAVDAAQTLMSHVIEKINEATAKNLAIDEYGLNKKLETAKKIGNLFGREIEGIDEQIKTIKRIGGTQRKNYWMNTVREMHPTAENPGAALQRLEGIETHSRFLTKEDKQTVKNVLGQIEAAAEKSGKYTDAKDAAELRSTVNLPALKGGASVFE